MTVRIASKRSNIATHVHTFLRSAVLSTTATSAIGMKASSLTGNQDVARIVS